MFNMIKIYILLYPHENLPQQLLEKIEKILLFIL